MVKQIKFILLGLLLIYANYAVGQYRNRHVSTFLLSIPLSLSDFDMGHVYNFHRMIFKSSKFYIPFTSSAISLIISNTQYVKSKNTFCGLLIDKTPVCY